MDEIIQKTKEPSTWAGVGLLGFAIDNIFNIEQAATIGSDIITASANGTSTAGIVAIIVGSLFSIFLSEGKKK